MKLLVKEKITWGGGLGVKKQKGQAQFACPHSHYQQLDAATPSGYTEKPLLSQLSLKSTVKLPKFSVRRSSSTNLNSPSSTCMSSSLSSSRANPKDGPPQPQPAIQILNSLFSFFLFARTFASSSLAVLVISIFILFLLR